MVISNYYLSLSGKVKSKFIQDVIELCDISAQLHKSVAI